MFENYELWFGAIYQFDFVNVKVNQLVRSMFTMFSVRFIFVPISVGYIILVVIQMVLLYINL